MNITLDYKPHNKQKLIHKACSKDSPYKFVTIVAGRQSGKSKACQMQVIKWAFEKKCKIWVVSPTYSQALKFFKDISNPLIKSGVVKKANASQGDLIIEFINGSIIELKSAAAKDALRGTTLDYLVLDEAAFISEQTLNEILLPMIITKPKSKVLIVTTPKGKNWVYKYFNIENNKYFSLRFTSEDNPRADLDIISEFKKTMNEAMYNQEFLAHFVDSAAVFSNVDILASLNINHSYKEPVWGGIDIGMLNDFTVITLLNANGEMIYYDRFTNLESNALKERIKDTFKKFNISKCYIEKNNQGLPIYQDLKEDLGEVLLPFDTTATSKPQIINQLIAAFSKQEVKIINDEQLKKELGSFIFKFSKSGKIQFEAMSGMNDDMVMSLAIAWECLNKHKFITNFPVCF